MRKEKVTSASLIPGLRVQASGYYEAANVFAADRVTYNRSDMKMAAAIRGGVEPTDLRSLDNQRRIGENSRTIAQQQQTLQRQAAEIANNAHRIRINDEKIVGTTGRIDSLDNYNVVSTVIVYFRNGQARIDPENRRQLRLFAAQAKGVRGYMTRSRDMPPQSGPRAQPETEHAARRCRDLRAAAGRRPATEHRRACRDGHDRSGCQQQNG